MNKEIITRWNRVVEQSDTVYLLGDVMLNDDASGLACLHQLNGAIHIILGNHDTDNRIPLYQSSYNVVEVTYATRLAYNKQRFYLSHYPTICANADGDKPLSRCTVNLCGHTHTTDPFCDWNLGKIYHCELDAHFLMPVSLDQVIADLQRRMK
jgi:calcineurin-like phosphoesterase family protein